MREDEDEATTLVKSPSSKVVKEEIKLVVKIKISIICLKNLRN